VKLKLPERPIDVSVIALSRRDANIFFETLKNPPPPNAQLLDVVRQYKKRQGGKMLKRMIPLLAQ
jgi:hypothetical protein